MKYEPVIIVVAYNRPKSLERLLVSLKNAKNISNAKLIISIDNQEPDNYNIRDIANNFDWPFGEKEVIYQKEKLGLRKHILKCGDLSKEYGSVIILEDDLFVSPYFYDYTTKALEFFGEDENIGGISLYNQPFHEVNELPFHPITDEADNYFLQFPSSWGQSWTYKQWSQFKNWYNTDPDISKIPISSSIIEWPASSWKKYFCAYLVAFNKYFVFPRLSLTTNFNDQGTHKILRINHNGQTPLEVFENTYHFKKFSDSFCKYDTHFELDPEAVKRFRPELENFSFVMDLYGTRELSQIESPFVITSRPVKQPVKSFQRALKPHEMNVILNLEGNEIFLCKTENVLNIRKNSEDTLRDFRYYYTSFFNGYKFLFYDYFAKYKIFRFLFK